MSFFDDVIDSIFGGTDRSAQAAQQSANEAAAQRINVTSGQARSDVLDLFPQAQEARNLGFQAALDVLGGSVPAQLSAFQQGNLGAQQNLLSGLPQFQNAILGNAIDLSGLQPSAVNVPTQFLQQQIPFGNAGAAQGAQPQVTQTDLESFARLLGGAPNFSPAASTGGEGRDRATGGDALGGAPFAGFNFSAEELDTAQKLGGLLGFAGPAGSLAGFALGQAARVAANEAFPGQEPIGFFEDILRPDTVFGSPFDLLQQGATDIKAQQLAEQQAAAQRARKAQDLRDAIARGDRVAEAAAGGRDFGGVSGRAQGLSTRETISGFDRAAASGSAA